MCFPLFAIFPVASVCQITPLPCLYTIKQKIISGTVKVMGWPGRRGSFRAILKKGFLKDYIPVTNFHCSFSWVGAVPMVGKFDSGKNEGREDRTVTIA